MWLVVQTVNIQSCAHVGVSLATGREEGREESNVLASTRPCRLALAPPVSQTLRPRAGWKKACHSPLGFKSKTTSVLRSENRSTFDLVCRAADYGSCMSIASRKKRSCACPPTQELVSDVMMVWVRCGVECFMPASPTHSWQLHLSTACPSSCYFS